MIELNQTKKKVVRFGMKEQEVDNENDNDKDDDNGSNTNNFISPPIIDEDPLVSIRILC